MPKSPPSISDALRAAIRASGLTSYALGKQAEVSPIVIDRFLNGERDLRLGTVDKIAKALGLKLVE